MNYGMNILNIMGCSNTKTLNDCTASDGSYKPKNPPEGGSKKSYLTRYSLDGSSSQTLRGLPEERPEFTCQQKKIVLDSWKVIQRDISRVGVVMFIG